LEKSLKNQKSYEQLLIPGHSPVSFSPLKPNYSRWIGKKLFASFCEPFFAIDIFLKPDPVPVPVPDPGFIEVTTSDTAVEIAKKRREAMISLLGIEAKTATSEQKVECVLRLFPVE